MSYKIVADSSANLLCMEGVDYAFAPLHILVGELDFTDDETLDTAALQQALKLYKGKTSTSCPAPQLWVDSFGQAEAVFCVTITSGLSGSCAAAHAAKRLYEAEHPGRVVYVVDSLSAGPEMALLLEKLAELVRQGLPHAEIYRQICEYQKRTHLFFSLAGLNTLARNGRVNPILAKGIGVLGIRVIGRASEEGTLKPMDKARGDKKAIACLIDHMKDLGYYGGRVVISHTEAAAAAEELKNAIAATFGGFNGVIMPNRGLCGYYAEPQSLMLGFEV